LNNPSAFLVRFAPGVDRERAVANLRRDLTGFMFTPRPHAEVRNLQRVGGLPGLLAGLVVLLALAMMTHTLVTSVRRRRRDLAVLKTLGSVPAAPRHPGRGRRHGPSGQPGRRRPGRAASRLRPAAALRSE
jgi:hypothetical protein